MPGRRWRDPAPHQPDAVCREHGRSRPGWCAELCRGAVVMLVAQRASISLLSQAEVKIYQMVNTAAEQGEPCPVNIDLEDAAGFSSCSMGSKIIARLEAKGHVLVERSQKARRVQIIATGKWTAWPDWHKSEATRMDRGAHDDSFLLGALVRLGIPRDMALMKVATLQELNRLSKDLERIQTLAGRRIGGIVRGEG